MNTFLVFAGAVLFLLFFLNLKYASELLCRIISGFGILFILDRVAAFYDLEIVGINLVTATVAGILGLPGCAL